MSDDFSPQSAVMAAAAKHLENLNRRIGWAKMFGFSGEDEADLRREAQSIVLALWLLRKGRPPC